MYDLFYGPSKQILDMFPIKNGLKQGDTLLPLLLKFALEYTIRCVEQNCRDGNWILYIRFRFMLMMFIYQW